MFLHICADQVFVESVFILFILYAPLCFFGYKIWLQLNYALNPLPDLVSAVKQDDWLPWCCCEEIKSSFLQLLQLISGSLV